MIHVKMEFASGKFPPLLQSGLASLTKGFLIGEQLKKTNVLCRSIEVAQPIDGGLSEFCYVSIVAAADELNVGDSKLADGIANMLTIYIKAFESSLFTELVIYVLVQQYTNQAASSVTGGS